MSKPIYEEVIDEIGTQVLAKYNLNIFDSTSYAQSVEATRMKIGVKDIYNSPLINNPRAHGFLFEELDAGMRNIEEARNKSDKRYIRKDRISDKANDELVDVVAIKEKDVVRAEKKDDSVEYLEQMQHKCYESKESQAKRKPKTKIISKSDSLKGENKKYMNEPDLQIVVNSDRFDEDTNHYEKAEEKSNNKQVKDESKIMKEKLTKGKVDYETAQKENALNFVKKTEVKHMAKNLSGVAFSQSTMVALQTFGSGLIYEIKDYNSAKDEISLIERFKRLLQKTIMAFKDGFINGAKFGAIDILINIISSFFKKISTQILYLWKNLRNALKSVYNAIVSYVKGTIKDFKTLLSTISKGILSAIFVLLAAGIESQINTYLKTLLPSGIASVLSGIFAISICAVGVILSSKIIDNALNYLFGVYADLIKSRERRAEIEKVIDEFLPQLVEDNEKLETLIKTKFKDMKLKLDSSFEDLQNAIIGSNSILFINSLVQINGVYGQKLKYISFKEFDQAMLSDNVIKI